MALYIARRLLMTIPLLLGILLVTFGLMQMVPGDPVERMLGEKGATPEERARLIRANGLDRPWPVRFGYYLASLARGDLGRSYGTQVPVSEEIRSRLPNTVALAFTALIIASVLGISSGIISAALPNTWLDHAVRIMAVFGLSTPVFWFGLMLMLFFAVKLNWLPAASDTDNLLVNLLLPSLTLGLRPAAFIQRVMRSNLLEVLRMDFTRTARAKGLSEWSVVLKHALRNAMIPVVTLIGIDLGSLLSGSVITETIFNYRGLGRYALDGIMNREYNVVMATVLFTSFIFLIANLVVDVLYGFLDPRIRYA